jgi:hypothetical protein
MLLAARRGAAVASVLGLLALPAPAAPDGPLLLGLERRPDDVRPRLVEVDPLTLEAAGDALDLPDTAYQAWSRSPDGSTVALAPWDVARVRLVAADGLRRGRDVVLPAGHFAQQLDWIAADRLLALIGSCCEPAQFLAVIDTARGRIVRRHDAPGPVLRTASSPQGLVLVVGRPGLGTARLALVRPDGRVPVVALPRTQIGARRLPGDYRSGVRVPGLAVDAAAGRAFVVGADEPVAEVDLRTLRVRYHRLAAARTVQAVAKGAVGPERFATWVDGVLAVTGWNARGVRLDGRDLHYDPAGVHLIDPRAWRRRTVASLGRTFAASGDSVAVPLAARLAVFGADGSARFSVPGTFTSIQAAGGRAYAGREYGGVVVVDLATGAATEGSVAEPPTLLVP